MTNNLEGTIGIDVAKSKLDIMILPEKKHYVIDNNRKSIKKFISKELAEYSIDLVAMESTGGYEKEVASCLREAGIATHIAHATRVHYYAKSKGIFGKTDKVDAGILARYAAESDVVVTEKPSKEQEHLQVLSSRRSQLQGMLVAEKNRLSSAFHRELQKSTKRIIKQLEREMLFIEKAMATLIENDAILTKKCAIFESVRGVGRKTSMVLAAELTELGSLSKSKISALVGLAPRNSDSGMKKGKRKIIGGRASVRKALYMCALAAIRCNKSLKAFYDKLHAQGKLGKVALIAVARKLLIMLNAMVRNNTPWTEEYTRS